MNFVGLCCKFCVFDGSSYLTLVFYPSLESIPHMCGSGISQVFEQTLFTEFGAFSFPRYPPYFLAAAVALNSTLWFFRPERVWIFFWHFICPVQHQLWLVLKQTVIKNRWPFPFFQESVLSWICPASAHSPVPSGFLFMLFLVYRVLLLCAGDLGLVGVIHLPSIFTSFLLSFLLPPSLPFFLLSSRKEEPHAWPTT